MHEVAELDGLAAGHADVPVGGGAALAREDVAAQGHDGLAAPDMVLIAQHRDMGAALRREATRRHGTDRAVLPFGVLRHDPLALEKNEIAGGGAVPAPSLVRQVRDVKVVQAIRHGICGIREISFQPIINIIAEGSRQDPGQGLVPDGDLATERVAHGRQVHHRRLAGKVRGDHDHLRLRAQVGLEPLRKARRGSILRRAEFLEEGVVHRARGHHAAAGQVQGRRVAVPHLHVAGGILRRDFVEYARVARTAVALENADLPVLAGHDAQVGVRGQGFVFGIQHRTAFAREQADLVPGMDAHQAEFAFVGDGVIADGDTLGAAFIHAALLPVHGHEVHPDLQVLLPAVVFGLHRPFALAVEHAPFPVPERPGEAVRAEGFHLLKAGGQRDALQRREHVLGLARIDGLHAQQDGLLPDDAEAVAAFVEGGQGVVVEIVNVAAVARQIIPLLPEADARDAHRDVPAVERNEGFHFVVGRLDDHLALGIGIAPFPVLLGRHDLLVDLLERLDLGDPDRLRGHACGGQHT